ncbi:hypothetical protein [Actinomadura nitritigenes]|uniref:hypothetical protein n=1 Tax=Actinomadura nitritigenes TaxID=134602 RepID=UPI001FB652B5|nr:hypothetical protein [Actinomadura nitritigenes]
MKRRSGRAPYTGLKPCSAIGRQGVLVDRQAHLPAGQRGVKVVEHQVWRLLDLRQHERLEPDDVVDPVEGLGTERGRNSPITRSRASGSMSPSE